ncbi:unnamed protein product, partial [Fusarium langsethiae]
PQKKETLEWEPLAKYPDPEEIKNNKGRKIERLKKKQEGRKKQPSEKKKETIAGIPDSMLLEIQF